MRIIEFLAVAVPFVNLLLIVNLTILIAFLGRRNHNATLKNHSLLDKIMTKLLILEGHVFLNCSDLACVKDEVTKKPPSSHDIIVPPEFRDRS
jgi:hypothetical protein